MRAKQTLQTGFSLLEVMIALAIFALVSGTLITNASQAINQTSIIQERTIAHWIAENALSQLRMLPRTNNNFPSLGTDRENLTMANKEWEVVINVEATQNQDMRRINISVFKDNELDQPAAVLSGFIGRN